MCYEERLGDTLQFLVFVPRFVQLGVRLPCNANRIKNRYCWLQVGNILYELVFLPNYEFALSLMNLPAALHVNSKEDIIIGSHT